MSMNVAVIDLGTNTFNFCVASVQDSQITKIFEGNEFPRLGENGVAYGYISEDAIVRGVDALVSIKKKIAQFNCEKIRLIGTSALRSASNAMVFCDKVKQATGYDIEIIQGTQEAEYIFYGNALAYDWGEKIALILDIGGGSNECIICNHSQVLWKHSFECGMQRIVSKFGLSHPSAPQYRKHVYEYLEENLELLREQLVHYQIDVFIGSSGAFDVFRSIYFATNFKKNPQAAFASIPVSEMHSLVKLLETSTLDEIENLRGMDLDRAPLLPVAGFIADYFLERFGFIEMVQSSYSLKEGVLYLMQ